MHPPTGATGKEMVVLSELSCATRGRDSAPDEVITEHEQRYYHNVWRFNRRRRRGRRVRGGGEGEEGRKRRGEEATTAGMIVGLPKTGQLWFSVKNKGGGSLC